MRCPKCGEDLFKGQLFCHKCGCSVQNELAKKEAQKAKVEKAEAKPKKKK